jgi:hypothetical protein
VASGPAFGDESESSAPTQPLIPGAVVRKRPRTHVSTTDRLDCVYTPVLPVAAEFRSYFEPTAITTPAGDLHPQILDDVMDVRYAPSRAAV